MGKKRKKKQPKAPPRPEPPGPSSPEPAQPEPAETPAAADESAPLPITAREFRVQTICLVFLSVCALIVALSWLRPVMEPFMLALFIALALSALVQGQQRLFGIPRPLALGSTMLLGLLCSVVLWWVSASSVRQMISHSALYQKKAEKLLQQGQSVLQDQFGGMGSQDKPPNVLPIAMDSIKGIFRTFTTGLLALLSKGMLVLVFVLFLLFGSQSLRAPPGGVLQEITLRVQSYIFTKFIISLVTGVLVGTLLYLFGVRLALTFGFFAFLLNFIPTIGSVIATLLPIPLILLSPLPISAKLGAIFLPGLLQFAIGNVLEPRIMGRSFDLHPVVVILALIMWGMLWGITGMLLATPMTAILKIILERLPTTKPIAELMAGRVEAVNQEAVAFTQPEG